MNICRSLFEDYGCLYCSSLLPPFFYIPSSWGLPFLYSLLEAIVDLYLLIIWTLTCVLVPSNTPFQPSVSCGGQGSTIHKSSPH